MRAAALLLPLAVLAACAEPLTPVAAPKAAPSREESCLAAARECGHHAIDGKTEGLVDCMPAEVVEKIGGRAKILETLKANEEDKTKAGADFEESVMEAPTQLVKGTGRTFAVVPQTIGVKVPEGRVVLKSYLLGVSADDGKTWHFVDGVELDHEKALDLFPDLPATLTFPKVNAPTMEENSSRQPPPPISK